MRPFESRVKQSHPTWRGRFVPGPQGRAAGSARRQIASIGLLTRLVKFCDLVVRNVIQLTRIGKAWHRVFAQIE
jgi:hypothetical protein